MDESNQSIDQINNIYHTHQAEDGTHDHDHDDQPWAPNSQGVCQDSPIISEIPHFDDINLSPPIPNQLAIHVSSWNISGLADYKQYSVLQLAYHSHVDILCICETHLVNEEQLIQWQQNVDQHGFYSWVGRSAIRLKKNERGRGSGGIGILIRKDWDPYVIHITPCQHDCLIFTQLQLPSCPFTLTVGAAYLVPPGCHRFKDNEYLLCELEEVTSIYQRTGMVLIAGDFNIHIGQLPSVAWSDAAIIGSNHLVNSGHVADSMSQYFLRTSMDPIGDSVMDDDGKVSQTRGSQFVDRMNMLGLLILNGLIDIGEGHVAEATRGSQSVIDYFLVDSNYWQCMSSVRVVKEEHTGMISDHKLISVTIRFNDKRQTGSHSAIDPNVGAVDVISALINCDRFHTASRGDESHWREFISQCKSTLTPLLESWRHSMSVGETVEVETAWADFTHHLRQTAANTIGLAAKKDGRKNKSHTVHGHASSQLRQCQHARHKLWRSKYRHAAMRIEWPLYFKQKERKLNDRIKHHLRTAIRWKQMHDISVMAAMRGNRMREHWYALKRLGSLHSIAPPIPTLALDSSGLVHDTIPSVRQVWLDFWAQLAQHKGEDGRFDQQFYNDTMETMEEMNEQERRIIQPTWSQERIKGSENINDNITLEEVNEAVKRLSNGKAAGCDGIVTELLKNGGPIMVQCLHQLCCIIFHSRDVPLAWLRGIIVPIHKDGDKNAPQNYRPITLLSIVGKVYTSILLQRLQSWSEAHDIIVEEQGGFRPHRGCPEQLFALTEMIKIRRMQGKRTFTAFIDIKKAYDTVWHAGLKRKLLEAGVHGAMYRALTNLYDGCESTIKLGSTLGYTDFFPVENGVRQGCILSPWLYSLYINDLAVIINQQVIGGVPIGSSARRLHLLLYADDIVLLAESSIELQLMLDAVTAYAHRWRFELNHSKCGLIRFGRSSVLPHHQLTLSGAVVAWVHVYKYLGVELHDTGVPFKAFHKRMLASASRAASAVTALGMHSGKLPVPIGIQVYKSLVRPLLEYASEVASIGPRPWMLAEKLQTRMGKRILQCWPRTSSVTVLGELGWMSMEARYQQSRVAFWGKIHLLPPTHPCRLIYDTSAHMYAQLAASDEPVIAVSADSGWDVVRAPSHAHGLTLWPAQLQRDLYELGLADYWCQPARLYELSGVTHMNKLTAWRSLIKMRVHTREQAHWRRLVSGHSSLLTYMQIKKELCMESYLTDPHGGWNDLRLRGRRFMTRLRTGSNELRINTGRWENIPRDERYCLLCGEDIETEQHFLLECSHYAAERLELFQWINAQVLLIHSDIPVHLAGPNMFDIAHSSLTDRLTVMCGGSISIVSRSKQDRCIRAHIMTELEQWRRKRSRHLELLMVQVEKERK